MSLKKMFVLAGVAAALFASSAYSREPVKPQSKNLEAQKYIDKAWDAVAVDLTIKNIDIAISALKKAEELDPKNIEILVALADEYWQRGDLMPKGNDEEWDARNHYFNKGKEAAEKALAIKESAGGHYWYCANLASSYENRSVFAQAGIFLDLKKHMEWIENNEVGYLYGGYARFWGQVLARIPDIVVKLTGQDPNEVYEKLENAIKIEPRYLLNYVDQGQFLHRMGEDEKALDALKKAIETKPEIFPEELAKNKHAKKRALGHWKEFTGKEYPEK